jgi:hypothetical protein
MVTLAKATDAEFKGIVSSVELTDSFEMTDEKGKKAQYSIRLETWQVPDARIGQTEVRIVIRDVNTGQFHGATNFKQNLALELSSLMSGTHSNVRKPRKGKK